MNGPKAFCEIPVMIAGKGEVMELDMQGRTALVGGASRGLGLAVSERLAAEGMNLVMVSRGREALTHESDRLAAEYGVNTLPIPADQSQEDEIRRVLELAMNRFDRMDVLFHNTGGPPPGLFDDHDDAAWTKAYEALLLSVVRLCRGVLPAMRKQKWGRILINTSFTVKEPAPRLILSNVFRTGVVALAKTLSREVAADGITVNCICPGAFATQRLDSIFEEQAANSGRPIDDVRNEWTTGIPIGRILDPGELGDLVAFLASDRAKGITGSCIPIEGGMLHGLF